MKALIASCMDEALPRAMQELLMNGDEVGSRNGRVKEILNTQIVLTDPANREVLSPARAANVFAQIAETMWVLAGRNDITWLSRYLPRAKDYSDDEVTWQGGYGPRIRNWQTDVGPAIDQLEYVVESLQENPLSRQAVISIYDPRFDTALDLLDRPCNVFLQFQNRGGLLHMTVTVRSNDAMWGWSGINAFEWSTLQEIVASLLWVGVGTLTFNAGNLHVYEPHWQKARSIVEAGGKHFVDLPTVPFNPDRLLTTVEDVDRQVERWFLWESMCRSGSITYAMLQDMEDPLFRSWAAAIAYYWTRDHTWMTEWKSVRLWPAVLRCPASLLPEPVQPSPGAGAGTSTPTASTTPTVAYEGPHARFYAYATHLHAVKHAAYGNSWKKRGEMLSILPNIARKVDRLGVEDELESKSDTMIDLWIYLAKYLCWIDGEEGEPEQVDPLLRASLIETEDTGPMHDWFREIPRSFDAYADNHHTMREITKRDFIEKLFLRVTPMARDLWEQENEYRGADGTDAEA